MFPAIVSGNVTGDAPLSYWTIFSVSIVTVPKVFASYLGPVSFSFVKWRIFDLVFRL